MLEMGIIGCGRIVEQGHVAALEALCKKVRVVAVADPTEERRNFIGEKFGVDAEVRFADYKDMLRNVELDFVDQALPHALHEEAVVATAEAGVHILTEKPLTTDLASARRMVDAVEKKRRQTRHSP